MATRLTLATRLLLAAVFILAAFFKAMDFVPTARAVSAAIDQGFIIRDAFLIVSVLASIELGLGLWLLSGRGAVAVIVSAVVMLVILTVALALLLLDPRAPFCGCFGGLTASLLTDAREENFVAIIRNLLLIFAATTAVVLARKKRTIDREQSPSDADRGAASVI